MKYMRLIHGCGAVLGASLSAGCAGDDSATASANAAGTGGAGVASATSSSTFSASTNASNSSSALATTAGSGGAPNTFVCDPPAAPGSLYEIAAVSYDIDRVDPVSMCHYRGDVMLIVNTAAL